MLDNQHHSHLYPESTILSIAHIFCCYKKHTRLYPNFNVFGVEGSVWINEQNQRVEMEISQKWTLTQYKSKPQSLLKPKNKFRQINIYQKKFKTLILYTETDSGEKDLQRFVFSNSIDLVFFSLLRNLSI